jgi:hypothetical protein
MTKRSNSWTSLSIHSTFVAPVIVTTPRIQKRRNSANDLSFLKPWFSVFHDGDLPQFREAFP